MLNLPGPLVAVLGAVLVVVVAAAIAVALLPGKPDAPSDDDGPGVPLDEADPT